MNLKIKTGILLPKASLREKGSFGPASSGMTNAGTTFWIVVLKVGKVTDTLPIYLTKYFGIT